MAGPTLRNLLALPDSPAPISESVLVLIDCQQTYREGVMQLDGVEPALAEAAALLKRFRAAGRPVIHIMHDAGPDTPYDVNAPIGQIADSVAPIDGETVIVKNLPSSFEGTNLDEELKRLQAENVVYAGFMTHMCVNSTARASFNRGYATTVVAGATATRDLPEGWAGKTVPAGEVQDASLSALADLFAVVVPDTNALKD
ncbi:Streptothricin hydrolase [Methyloligella halotolerans]|uniref:Streptothricin hydrolase n=1 Tax=Methyloligella halotolerans TaxID=1177755 RepID=A0A1E2S2I6_9HYPH|nr:cysteine hydrolase family protein [Methyloligella halotolerans]ODA68726.1 Streptothricin hydrolase [Methyloligella halotolerans]